MKNNGQNRDLNEEQSTADIDCWDTSHSRITLSNINCWLHSQS